MEGELILLGTGTGVPSLKRSSSAYLVRSGGKKIVIDFGPGTLRRLLEVGIDYNGMDLILITHTHPDHVSDLIPFLFATRYPSNPRTKDLKIVGSLGLRSFLDDLNRAFKGALSPKFYRVDVREVGRESWSFDGIVIGSHPVKHTEESLGYWMIVGGKRIAFSGDAEYSKGLVELARGADLFVCESSLPDGMETEGHLTPSQAGRIAAEAGVKRLILTHFYPEVEKEPFMERIRRYFAGEVMVGVDLMRLLI